MSLNYNILDAKFEDTGCDLFDACLECPLPECRYDISIEKQLRLAHLLRILDLWMTNEYTIKDLAKRLKVGSWTVLKAIEYEGRREELERFIIVEELFGFTNQDVSSRDSGWRIHSNREVKNGR
jgi:hypothetical protein|tara:strand:- start:59 stop:430 length:372 start_codon:yes stop_codon:yes gene_type:complete